MSERSSGSAAAYWQANIRLVLKLLVVWFVVSYGCGILLVDVLNNFHIGGYPLGYFFAQQGAIYVFLFLIFFYAVRMNKLDRDFGVQEEE
jgi:putative solute:sodium symporter small subunit